MITLAAHGTEPLDVARTCVTVAREAARQITTRLWAQHAIRDFLHRDTIRDTTGRWYVGALAAWARTIAPLREPATVGELVQSPWRTVAYRSGDCDDVAAAVAAFASVVGLPAAIVVYPTGPADAHIAAVIGDDWRRGTDAHIGQWQIDQFGLSTFTPKPGMHVLAI